MSPSDPSLTPQVVWEARRRLQPYIFRTPLVFSEGLSRITGCQIYLKAECWQLCGCFKVRGAVNMVAALTGDQRRKGLVTCSSGNHGAAVSFAAGLFGGARAVVFVPENAEKTKTEKIEAYGAEIVYHDGDFLKTLDRALAYAEQNGSVFVHSHGHPLIIAGRDDSIEALDRTAV